MTYTPVSLVDVISNDDKDDDQHDFLTPSPSSTKPSLKISRYEPLPLEMSQQEQQQEMQMIPVRNERTSSSSSFAFPGSSSGLSTHRYVDLEMEESNDGQVSPPHSSFEETIEEATLQSKVSLYNEGLFFFCFFVSLYKIFI